MRVLKILLLLLIAAAACHAAPALSSIAEAEANVTRYESSNDGSGNYYFSYETSNGIKRKETGTLVNSGQPDQYIAVEGTVSYTNPDGKLITFNYSADKNGYHVLDVYTISSQGQVPPALLTPAVSPLVLASLLGSG